MAITDPTAIRFSNERLRVGANRLAMAYYLAKQAKDRWTSLGSNQAALDIMSAQIRAAADHMASLYYFASRLENTWHVLGGAAMIPNTSETISDGSPGDGRPAATGAKATNIVTRCEQYQNWLLSLAGSFTDGTRAQKSYLNTVLAACNEAKVTLSLGDAGNFINRCSELCANYDASSGANLNTVLAYAPNPPPGL